MTQALHPRACGVGSLPGLSAQESARIIVGELPDLIHVGELPHRGPGADMIGRTGAMLSSVSRDLSLETTAAGWRFAAAPGTAMRRGMSWLAEDLDMLQEQAHGYSGPIKGQIAGPWTMAASVELTSGERALRDVGAWSELVQALALAAVNHVQDLRRRFPLASSIILQVDEPALVSVIEGSIGTASGLSRYAPIGTQTAGNVLSQLLQAIAEVRALPVVHCCADNPPIDLIMSAGAGGISVDFSRSLNPEQLGTAWEGKSLILAGVVPSTGRGRLSDTSASAPIRQMARQLGLNDPRHMGMMVVTPACGLAAATPTWVRTAYGACRAAARILGGDAGSEREDR